MRRETIHTSVILFVIRLIKWTYTFENSGILCYHTNSRNEPTIAYGFIKQKNILNPEQMNLPN
jgi:hypothetical protein